MYTYRFYVTMYDSNAVHILNWLQHLQKYVEGHGFSKLSPQLFFEARDTLPFQIHNDKALLVEVFLTHKVEYGHNSNQSSQFDQVLIFCD